MNNVPIRYEPMFWFLRTRGLSEPREPKEPLHSAIESTIAAFTDDSNVFGVGATIKDGERIYHQITE